MIIWIFIKHPKMGFLVGNDIALCRNVRCQWYIIYIRDNYNKCLLTLLYLICKNNVTSSQLRTMLHFIFGNFHFQNASVMNEWACEIPKKFYPPFYDFFEMETVLIWTYDFDDMNFNDAWCRLRSITLKFLKHPMSNSI